MFDWFFSPAYSRALIYILIGFIAVFVVVRFLVPSLKPAIESFIINLGKKYREKKNDEK